MISVRQEESQGEVEQLAFELETLGDVVSIVHEVLCDDVDLEDKFDLLASA